VLLRANQALLDYNRLLVQEIIAMKRDGWTPADKLGEPAKAVELPKEIEAAIHALGVDAGTARHLRGEAWEMLRAGTAHPEIIQRITDGEPVEL
jgi:hypothetical protein